MLIEIKECPACYSTNLEVHRHGYFRKRYNPPGMYFIIARQCRGCGYMINTKPFGLTLSNH